MRRTVRVAVVAVLASVAPWLQGQDQKAEIQKRLASQLALTKLTADGRDIVTPGSIVVLQKDGLVMFSIDTRIVPTYTYKDGKFSMGFGTTLATNMALGRAQQGANVSNVPQRKFVSGEKFWAITTSVKDDGVFIGVYSDPYADVRYFGAIKFPFQKHSIPPADDVLKTIAEVLAVQPADNSSSNTQSSAPAPSDSALAPAVPAPIAPPPPPADAPPAPPKTIALGQTKDQVVASFGQPQKIVNLGTKEIYYYPDMKVTFVGGKVADVQ
jgi:hypothetical protein